MTMHFDQTDYSVVVKNRAPPPNAWRWEIYRAGRSSPIEQSSVFFHTVVTANMAGKEALKGYWTNSMPNQTPKPPNNNAKFIDRWDDDGGAPSGGDRSVRKRPPRSGSSLVCKVRNSERKLHGFQAELPHAAR